MLPMVRDPSRDSSSQPGAAVTPEPASWQGGFVDPRVQGDPIRRDLSRSDSASSRAISPAATPDPRDEFDDVRLLGERVSWSNSLLRTLGLSGRSARGSCSEP